jgi:hypothetical protein
MEVSSDYRDDVVVHAVGVMMCFVRLFDRSGSRIPAAGGEM